MVRVCLFDTKQLLEQFALNVRVYQAENKKQDEYLRARKCYQIHPPQLVMSLQIVCERFEQTVFIFIVLAHVIF